jgi:type IV pilus assembly protein PilW
MSRPFVVHGRFLQLGLTLVELLVALILGLVLLAGVVTVFIANRQTFRVQEALARGQEAGRFALTLMERDLRSAGYFGCASRRDIPIKNALNPSGNSYNWDYGVAVQVYNASDKSTVPAYPPALENTMNANGTAGKLNPLPVPGSDVITVRSAGGCNDTVTEHNDSSADLKLSQRACVCEGDILLVTNCVTGVIFQATNVTPDPCLGTGNSGNKTNVVHADGKGLSRKFDPGNATKDLGQKWVGGEIVKLVSRTYYVGDTGRDVDATGRGVRALYRTENGRPAEELVEGVENLQVWFGEDLNSNNAIEASEYKASELPVTSVNWANVRSVRLALLMHSADRAVTEQTQTVQFVDIANNTFADVTPSGVNPDGSDDRRLRQAFSTVVGLRNLLP